MSFQSKHIEVNWGEKSRNKCPHVKQIIGNLKQMFYFHPQVEESSGSTTKIFSSSSTAKPQVQIEYRIMF